MSSYDDVPLAEVLAVERLSFLEPEGKVGCRYGQDARDQETMDYLEFIARVTSLLQIKRCRSFDPDRFDDPRR